MALDQAIHRKILIKILKDIFSDHQIGPALGFKGGTAAHLFYNLERFSVDLDFDLLNQAKEDIVFERVKKILENYGTLKEVAKKRYNLLYLLSYADKLPDAQNVKVEINRRDFGSKYAIESYLGISMKVMVREDMAAHKMVAMLERIGKTNRDIFDVWFFLQKDWPINKEIIETRTKLPFRKFMEKCIALVEKFDDRNILAGIGELLDEKQKAWAKKNLKKDLLFALKLRASLEK